MCLKALPKMLLCFRLLGGQSSERIPNTTKTRTPSFVALFSSTWWPKLRKETQPDKNPHAQFCCSVFVYLVAKAPKGNPTRQKPARPVLLLCFRPLGGQSSERKPNPTKTRTPSFVALFSSTWWPKLRKETQPDKNPHAQFCCSVFVHLVAKAPKGNPTRQKPARPVLLLCFRLLGGQSSERKPNPTKTRTPSFVALFSSTWWPPKKSERKPNSDKNPQARFLALISRTGHIGLQDLELGHHRGPSLLLPDLRAAQRETSPIPTAVRLSKPGESKIGVAKPIQTFTIMLGEPNICGFRALLQLVNDS